MIDPAKLNLAIALYVGYGVTSFPKPNGERLIAEFGKDDAGALEAEVCKVLADVDEIQIDWSQNDLEGAISLVISELLRTHPYLDKSALSAIRWHFSYLWK